MLTIFFATAVGLFTFYSVALGIRFGMGKPMWLALLFGAFVGLTSAYGFVSIVDLYPQPSCIGYTPDPSGRC